MEMFTTEELRSIYAMANDKACEEITTKELINFSTM